MRLAQHLAVLNTRGTTLAPSRHVVGIHVLQVPYTGMVLVVTDSTEWAVALTLLLGRCRLPGIDGLLCRLVEHTDIQQFGVLTAIEDILVDALLLLHIIALIEFAHLGGHRCRVVGRLVKSLIQFTHFSPHISFSGVKSNTEVIQSMTEVK